MATLVVVESPKKAKSIQSMLGSGFTVVATFGHIADLPTGRLGIDTSTMEVEYVPLEKKVAQVRRLRAAAKTASGVLLATDPDREGEAIAWHVARALKPNGKGFQRVEFHEITERAVIAAVAAPRELDTHLVDAQQARRVIDRLCGYEISPLLWGLQKGLSAGRVQSAALHLVASRERERRAFDVKQFHEVRVTYSGGLSADLVQPHEEKPHQWVKRRFEQLADAQDLVTALGREPHKIQDVRSQKVERAPQPPFTTAALQQAASALLDLSPKDCMRLAQELFEGGFITYHRTDSVRVASEAATAAREYIRAHAPECLPPSPPEYRSRASSQGAHEAVRPTALTDPPALAQLSEEARALHALIRSRFLASQSKPSLAERSEVIIAAGTHRLLAVVERELEAGWRRWGRVGEPLERDDEPQAPPQQGFDKGMTMLVEVIEPVHRKTKPPPAYTQASLVSAMERAGIGRPSTYAPTITILLEREYVAAEGKALVPTALGLQVDDFLARAFGDFVEPAFTAEWERELDGVAEGRQQWRTLCQAFYAGLRGQLERARSLLPPPVGAAARRPPTPTDKRCPSCDAPLVLREGSAGQYLACTGYPRCSVTLDADKPLPRAADLKCPDCDSPMLVFAGRTGEYLRCVQRKCKKTLDAASLVAAGGASCSECGRPMVRRDGKSGPFLSCSRYPRCRATQPVPGDTRALDSANGPVPSHSA